MDNKVYARHLHTLLQRYQTALAQFHLNAIVIASGSLSYYFQDDNSHTFKPYAAAQQWLPFILPAGCFIVIKHDKPELIWPITQDFWHLDNVLPEGEWQSAWHIVPSDNNDWVHTLPKNSAFIGPDSVAGLEHNVPLMQWLDFDRAVKTDYEIDCMQRASAIAAKGHKAAQAAFYSGASELEIHLAYLQATEQDAPFTPYPNIVGINEHAAVLHYENKTRQRPFRPLTLLVDAGALCNGYASDITRTYAVLDDDFSALLADVDTLQQATAQACLAGTSYVDLHQQTLRGVAQLLKQHDLCQLDVDEQLEKKIPHHFFPHGLGHLLGLQVHDVGGRQVDAQGTLQAPPADSSFLRLTRVLNENMVVTVEPGLYFIPMLIEQLKANVKQHGCNLEKIEALMPYGGIRVEDNIVVGVEGVRNLTREAFAHLI